MKPIKHIITLAALIFISQTNAQTFTDLQTNEVIGNAPTKWNVIKGAATIGTQDGEKVILLDNAAIIAPEIGYHSYLSDNFTLKFQAYFDDVEKAMSYQSYSIRFWNGNGNYSMGYSKVTPLKLYRYGLYMWTTTGGQKEQYKEGKLDLEGRSGTWRNITINYNAGTLKVTIDRLQIVEIPNLRITPSMISIEGQYAQASRDYIRAIKNVTISGLNPPPTDDNDLTDDTNPTDSTTVRAGSGLEAIDEGNGIGWRLIGKDPENYGNIGKDAVDLSVSGQSSNSLGATGSYSIVTGVSTIASGYFSTAIGESTEASGENSTAMGNSTIASGQKSTAMGSETTASGYISTAMGYRTKASGKNSTAMGSETSAHGHYSTAMGNESTANDYSTAIGNKAQAAKYATALGNETKAMGDYSTALGNKTQAVKYATALGNETEATNYYATALGNLTKASGKNSTAMGFKTESSGEISTAMGYKTIASGSGSTAIGHQSTASGNYSTAIGKNTNATAENATALGLGTHAIYPNSLVVGRYNDFYDFEKVLFQVGNGGPSSYVGSNNTFITKGNAFTVFEDGHAGLAKNLVQNSDRRLKQNISDLSYGLQEVLALRPVSYLWKTDPKAPLKSIGLIAQEVQPLINEIVNVGEDKDKTLSLSYIELIPVLIKAIQEQQAIIKNQDNKIENLSSNLTTKDDDLLQLTARIKQIESLLKTEKL